jgi:hypothetical protein
LDIQKHKFGLFFLESGDRFVTVGTLPDKFNFLLSLEQLTQALARERFVIYDQGANFQAGGFGGLYGFEMQGDTIALFVD